MESSNLPAEQSRRAKIVATLGPSCSTETVFRELVRAGLDVARLNFSHGTHPEKLKLIEMVRKVSREEGKPICILGDLQGPKIRTGRLKNRIPVQLKAGQKLTITPRDIAGTATLIATTFPTLAENLEPGARILLSDGLIELYVTAVHGQDTECEVINGGMLGEHKGINLPGIPVRVPSLTAKDEEDLEFAIRSGVDAIAVSFVRTAEDIRLVRHRVAAMGAETWIIAKLEKPQAIQHLESILEAADGVMVARGDLGVEMPPEKVPAIQKHVIRRAGDYRKPVITATQMLESMIENPRPTRAEASDVANAIYDGTDAVMLSAETAAGKYPVEAVKMMAKIVLETESQEPLLRTTDRSQSGHVRLVGGRDHLRIDGSRRRGSGHQRHCRLYRDRDHRPPALQVPAQIADFRAEQRGAGDPPYDAALGRPSPSLQQAGHSGTDGRNRRALVGRGRVRPAAADSGHCRRDPHQIGLHQFSPPARAGGHPVGTRRVARREAGASSQQALAKTKRPSQALPRRVRSGR